MEETASVHNYKIIEAISLLSLGVFLLVNSALSLSYVSSSWLIAGYDVSLVLGLVFIALSALIFLNFNKIVIIDSHMTGFLFFLFSALFALMRIFIAKGSESSHHNGQLFLLVLLFLGFLGEAILLIICSQKEDKIYRTIRKIGGWCLLTVLAGLLMIDALDFLALDAKTDTMWMALFFQAVSYIALAYISAFLPYAEDSITKFN